jgi:hypothetical protein
MSKTNLIKILIALNIFLFLVIIFLDQEAVALGNQSQSIQVEGTELEAVVKKLNSEKNLLVKALIPDETLVSDKNSTSFFQNPIVQKIGDLVVFIIVILISKK